MCIGTSTKTHQSDLKSLSQTNPNITLCLSQSPVKSELKFRLEIAPSKLKLRLKHKDPPNPSQLSYNSVPNLEVFQNRCICNMAS